MKKKKAAYTVNEKGLCNNEPLSRVIKEVGEQATQPFRGRVFHGAKALWQLL